MRSIERFTESGHQSGTKCDAKSHYIFTIQLFRIIDPAHLLFTSNYKDLLAIFPKNVLSNVKKTFQIFRRFAEILELSASC